MALLGDIKIIDAHEHLYSPMNIDAHTVSTAEFNYSAVNVASLSQVGPEYLAQNAIGLLWKARAKDRGFFFGGLEYHWPGASKRHVDPLAQAKALIEVGCDGIKMLEGKPTTRKDLNIPLDDAIYDGFYDFLQSSEVTLLSHVADSDEFWDAARVPQWAIEKDWFYGDGTYVSQRQLFDENENVLRKYPRLKIILAHFYFTDQNLPRAHRLMEEFPNACLDVCPGIQAYWHLRPQADKWREFFIKYQDRLIYGTDLHDRQVEEKVSRMDCVRRFLETDDEFAYRGEADHTVKGIKLDRSVLEKIYHGNFEQLVSSKPRPLKKAAASKFCRQRLDRAKDLPGQPGQLVREKLKYVVAHLGK